MDNMSTLADRMPKPVTRSTSLHGLVLALLAGSPVIADSLSRRAGKEDAWAGMLARHADAGLIRDLITPSDAAILTSEQRLALAQLVVDHPTGFSIIKAFDRDVPLADYARMVIETEADMGARATMGARADLIAVRQVTDGRRRRNRR